MEAVGGLTGIAQDAETLALRPQVGWAVRDFHEVVPLADGRGSTAADIY